MKKSVLTLFVLLLTSTSFAGTVGVVSKPGDCAMINQASGETQIAEIQSVEPAEILEDTTVVK